MNREREQIEARIAELEAANEAATSWGAAVGARHEEIQELKQRLRRFTVAEHIPAQLRSSAGSASEPLNAIERQLDEMRSLKGWRLNLIRENVARLKADIEKLTDPVAVHINMLRGTIAKPSWTNIKHLYPEQFPDVAQPVGMRDALESIAARKVVIHGDRLVCQVCGYKSVSPHTEERHAPNCARQVARDALAKPAPAATVETNPWSMEEALSDDGAAKVNAVLAGHTPSSAASEVPFLTGEALRQSLRGSDCLAAEAEVNGRSEEQELERLAEIAERAKQHWLAANRQPSPAATVETKFDGELVNGQCKIGDYCQCCAGKPKMCMNYEGPGAHNSSSADTTGLLYLAERIERLNPDRMVGEKGTTFLYSEDIKAIAGALRHSAGATNVLTSTEPQTKQVSTEQAHEDVRRERDAASERKRYESMSTAEKCAEQGNGFLNDYD